MPLFEFVCNNCHSTFEQLIASLSKDESRKCPECGSENVKQQISLPGRPVFKGSGFYETDYKQKGK